MLRLPFTSTDYLKVIWFPSHLPATATPDAWMRYTLITHLIASQHRRMLHGLKLHRRGHVLIHRFLKTL